VPTRIFPLTPQRSRGGRRTQTRTCEFTGARAEKNWLRGLDLNQRPSGYEPDELPDCSTPRTEDNLVSVLRNENPHDIDFRYATRLASSGDQGFADQTKDSSYRIEIDRRGKRSRTAFMQVSREIGPPNRSLSYAVKGGSNSSSSSTNR
jgi:hypothetical protein